MENFPDIILKGTLEMSTLKNIFTTVSVVFVAVLGLLSSASTTDGVVSENLETMAPIETSSGDDYVEEDKKASEYISSYIEIVTELEGGLVGEDPIVAVVPVDNSPRKSSCQYVFDFDTIDVHCDNEMSNEVLVDSGYQLYSATSSTNIFPVGSILHIKSVDKYCIIHDIVEDEGIQIKIGVFDENIENNFSSEFELIRFGKI